MRSNSIDWFQHVENLAAKEVIPLGSPLAVSAKCSVESRTNRVTKECPEVKLWGQLHKRFFLLLSCEISSVYQCIEDFWEGRPQINLQRSKSLFTRATDMIFKKNFVGTRQWGA